MNQPELFAEPERAYTTGRHRCGEPINSVLQGNVVRFISKGSFVVFCPRCQLRLYAGAIESVNDPALGKARGQAAMGQVIDYAYEEWKGRFEQALTVFANRREPFTSEDITEIVGLPEGGGSLKNNVVGALMNAAAQRGTIRKTGTMGISRAPRSHGREIRLWVGI